MLTYELKKAPGMPLYEDLYRQIREDILTGVLRPGEKLPSKRALAQNLEVGKITVEAAYTQLLSEGYITSREKIGYFVEKSERPWPGAEKPARSPVVNPAPEALLDLTANGTGQFPFSVWIRLQRAVILDYGKKLLLPLPNQGVWELREAIAEHLAAFRGMVAAPENILIGAGTDFLYNLLIQLLGQDKVYAVEEPGYDKTRRIYGASGVRCINVPMDESGVRPDGLGGAQVLHITPSHHFPTGIVMPVQRRRELLDWAAGDRWIIEDDYDSEFRFRGHPKPAMYSLDPRRVIYMNTFSKSLAPSIRISYMVLPEDLMAEFRRKLGFYSCTVPSFEQYTLARFLKEGYFEKHINRMRKFYQSRRNRVIQQIQTIPGGEKLTILEQDAGLHFLVKVDTEKSDRELTEYLLDRGIRVQTLSSYYAEPTPESAHFLVINYSGLDEEKLTERIREIDR